MPENNCSDFIRAWIRLTRSIVLPQCYFLLHILISLPLPSPDICHGDVSVVVNGARCSAHYSKLMIAVQSSAPTGLYHH